MPILTPEERVGTTLTGKYRLDRIVATGGMATVFAGTHAWTERTVAVKILNYEHARDPEVVRRFLQEARAAAQLKHPNIVDVLDMGQDDDGTVFLVLELLHGETLKARLKRGVIALHELGPLLAPILRAVASAHGKGVIHRDLKPDNIFLAIEPHAEEVHEPVPKLLDFGIAKVASEGDSGSTRTGTMVGTPQYMSPEQVRGEREVGPRADVWSMGVILHYALTRTMPFNAESAPAVLARVLTERAKPIRTIAPTVPDALAAVVDRALQHEPQQRFADMREMAAAFEAALGSLGLWTPAPSAREASRLYSASSGGFALAPAPASPTPIGATPTAIVPVAPLPAAISGGAPTALPSEYPPSPTTPYAWGAAPPPPVDETAPRPRRFGPVIAASVAALMLLGSATFWVVLGPMSEASTETARPLAPLAPAAAASGSQPLPAAASPSIAPAVVEPTVVEPAVVEPAVVEPAVVEPAVVEPAVVEPTVAEPAVIEPTVAERSDSEPTRTEPTRTEPTRTEPTRTEPTRTEPTRTEPTRTPRSGAAPSRGTGGALILSDDDDDDDDAPSGPRRGTRGAIILR